MYVEASINIYTNYILKKKKSKFKYYRTNWQTFLCDIALKYLFFFFTIHPIIK